MPPVAAHHIGQWRRIGYVKSVKSGQNVGSIAYVCQFDPDGRPVVHPSPVDLDRDGNRGGPLLGLWMILLCAHGLSAKQHYAGKQCAQSNTMKTAKLHDFCYLETGE